jgi:hypothetical protein
MFPAVLTALKHSIYRAFKLADMTAAEYNQLKWHNKGINRSLLNKRQE